MGAEEFLSIDPMELKFPFELKKQISASFQLLNKTDNYVAFKVKTNNPKQYSVRPNNGVVLPRSTCNVIVTMQAQRETPPDMQCKDRFLVQSVVARPGATPKDINPEMFNKDAGNHVEDCKLRVVFVSPPKPPISAAASSLLLKLTEEKNRTIQQNDKLRQELDFLRRRAAKSSGGVPLLYVVLIGLFGILMGNPVDGLPKRL
ncbi:vesicle associated protein [Actinidia rufa]|uniref:Vesicle associated protein n=1 Tax=Actinidia rufa TaxID=165716 RepID=A0A7J0E8G9_9ERIC|nr:vesicle associated protein [Actinidia rufa]